MPVTKQAEKKLRHDRIRAKTTAQKRAFLRGEIKKYRSKPSAKQLVRVFQALDKAAKINVIHKNKANRLKSRLSKIAVA